MTVKNYKDDLSTVVLDIQKGVKNETTNVTECAVNSVFIEFDNCKASISIDNDINIETGDDSLTVFNNRLIHKITDSLFTNSEKLFDYQFSRDDIYESVKTICIKNAEQSKYISYFGDPIIMVEPILGTCLVEFYSLGFSGDSITP